MIDMQGDGWDAPVHYATDHGVNVKWETWETSALHQDPGGIYSSLHMSDDVAPATASAGTECDFVMELKIPRFVVQKVFPDLAFNASAISAAIKIGESSVRYDVARETFLIRATTLEEVVLSKQAIAVEMSQHGFHLEIAGELPTAPAHAAPMPPTHSSTHPTLLPKTSTATRAPAAPPPVSHTQRAVGSTAGRMDLGGDSYRTADAYPADAHSPASAATASPSAPHPRLISRTIISSLPEQQQPSSDVPPHALASPGKYIWVEQGGKARRMWVEEDSSSDEEAVIAEELARQGLSSETPCSRLDQEELEKPAEAATHNTPAVHVMRQQAAEIQRLRQRVERQAVLLEDRCQAEMELRVKDKATRDTLEELRAANQALARDNKHLAQNLAQVVKERDQVLPACWQSCFSCPCLASRMVQHADVHT